MFGECRFEHRRMHFKRHGRVRTRSQKAAHKTLGVRSQAEDLKLYRVHESMKQTPAVDFVVKNHDVPEGRRRRMRKIRKSRNAHGFRFGIERRLRKVFAIQNNDSCPGQQFRREKRRQRVLMGLFQRLADQAKVLALFVQIARQSIAGIEYPGFLDCQVG